MRAFKGPAPGCTPFEGLLPVRSSACSVRCVGTQLADAHTPSLPPVSDRFVCSKVYTQLVEEGVIVPAEDFKPPEVPMDLDYAKKAGKVRASAVLNGPCLECDGLQLIKPEVPMGLDYANKAGAVHAGLRQFLGLHGRVFGAVSMCPCSQAHLAAALHLLPSAM